MDALRLLMKACSLGLGLRVSGLGFRPDEGLHGGSFEAKELSGFPRSFRGPRFVIQLAYTKKCALLNLRSLGSLEEVSGSGFRLSPRLLTFGVCEPLGLF